MSWGSTSSITHLGTLLSCVATVLIVSGCEYRTDKVDSQISPVQRPVGWAEIKLKVMQPSCMGCHATQNPDLSAYAPAAKAAAGIRKAVFAEHSMPKQGALSLEQEQILLAWLDSGTPEGIPVPEPSPASPGGTPVAVTWADVKAKVMDTACTSCHFPANPKNLSDFTDKEVVKADIGSVVGLSLSDLMPPPDNARPLPPELKRVLTEWWIAGLPEGN